MLLLCRELPSGVNTKSAQKYKLKHTQICANANANLSSMFEKVGTATSISSPKFLTHSQENS